MITIDGKLQIFELFVVDYELPKYKPSEESEESEADGEVMSMRPRRMGFSRESSAAISMSEPTGDYVVIGSIVGRIQRFFRRRRADQMEQIKPTVEEFFATIKGSTDELQIVAERGEGYARQIRIAEDAGQRALVEHLKKNMSGIRAEAQLVAIGHTQFIEELKAVEFFKQARRGVRLDWVRNFIRPIPEKIVNLKLSMDRRGIFDNYVVMHYDPELKSWAETEAELEARRDPILFGLIEGRRRLYFVGDWVDETCDLTLDQIADQLGANAVKTLE